MGPLFSTCDGEAGSTRVSVLSAALGIGSFGSFGSVVERWPLGSGVDPTATSLWSEVLARERPLGSSADCSLGSFERLSWPWPWSWVVWNARTTCAAWSYSCSSRVDVDVVFGA